MRLRYNLGESDGDDEAEEEETDDDLTTVDDDGNSSQLQLAEIGGNLSSEDVERLKLLAKGGGGAGAGSFRAQDASHSAKKAIGLLNSIQGLMVEWPLDFMCEDFKNLHPTALPGEIFK